ncbi:serine protein kinase RIO [Micromonospora endophytica]|uniref:non-specific serine/threonine protein kinase n=1 Tax=Micromonospora endophytica TaxID=515350 RepID=A0A2W2CPA2_9ACTN|nr:RIO1 family regulatory kinase/ATPase [Micromonospora endophytica]PZF93508.1 RIO-like kinase [Micromonospora endophytica]RIW40657.1 RIO-like kinase [Micromonospora endophytica]BCJ61364.1 RIO kinase 1 [Micromonospora endophytica]
MRDHDFPAWERRNRGKRRFDDDEPHLLKRSRPAETPADPEPDPGPAWSSWDDAVHGPQPHPAWLVTELAARDTELGVLKTGKEAEVHLVRRAVPDTDRSCLLAAKRYRDPRHRLFHRDAGYLEGRRVRRSREMRAMVGRTAFGRQMIAGQWAAAEFGALARLWEIGSRYGTINVPYPVQLRGTELMLEFLGDPDEGRAAPRLAELRPDPTELRDLWAQLVDALVVLARAGYAHGDLSPYNLLVCAGRLVLIDLPQVVDVVANPQGREFLARDVRIVATWFVARGLPPGLADPSALTELLSREAGLR